MNSHGYAISDDSRFVKAAKIIACLEYLDKGLQDSDVLEIGCGSGLISQGISQRAKKVTAIDITDETLKGAMGDRGVVELAFQFAIGDGASLPFQDNSFDIVVCNQVFEHVAEQQKLVGEIYRVLKACGLCYITAANRLWPIEPHTKLPLISCLPKPLADRYARRFRGLDEYDIALLTYWKWKRMLSKSFKKVFDLTAIVIKDPHKFYLSDDIPQPASKILKAAPLQVIRALIPFAPSWIFVGEKSVDGD